NRQHGRQIGKSATAAQTSDGPMWAGCIVPRDDPRTIFMELRPVSEREGVTPPWWADRSIMLPGQLPAADSHEACQRRPGDYEAQVGQRPVAIHALEHLGATDRGVIMFRQQIRRGIRAVKAGEAPQGLCRNAGAVIPTYCNDTVVDVPPGPTPEEDRQLMRATGQSLAESYLKHPPSTTGVPVAP